MVFVPRVPETKVFSNYTGHQRNAAPVSRGEVSAPAVESLLGEAVDDTVLCSRGDAEVADAHAAEATAPFEPGIGAAVAGARLWQRPAGDVKIGSTTHGWKAASRQNAAHRLHHHQLRVRGVVRRQRRGFRWWRQWGGS